MLSRGRDSQGEEVMRSYTPITLDSDIGYFELVVKVKKNCGQISHTYILSNFICENNHLHQLCESRCTQMEKCLTILDK